MVANTQEVINKRLRKHFLNYTYCQPSLLLKIMRDNISNNFAEVVQRNSFSSNMEYYIERAVTKKNAVSDYNIVKTI